MIRFTRSLYVTLFLCSFLFSQSRSELFRHDATVLFTQFYQMSQQVILPDRQNMLIVFGTTALLSTVSLADQSIKRHMLADRNVFFDNLSRIDRFFGERKITSLSLVGLYATGLVVKGKGIRITARQAMQAMFYTSFYTELLKISLGRNRPYATESPWKFKPFSGRIRHKSLPSGHTSITTAISTVFAKRSKSRIWKAFWYSAASAVAFARMYRNRHWFTDTVLGGIMGYSIGTWVTGQSGKRMNMRFHAGPGHMQVLWTLSLSRANQ